MAGQSRQKKAPCGACACHFECGAFNHSATSPQGAGAGVAACSLGRRHLQAKPRLCAREQLPGGASEPARPRHLSCCLPTDDCRDLVVVEEPIELAHGSLPRLPTEKWHEEAE